MKLTLPFLSLRNLLGTALVVLSLSHPLRADDAPKPPDAKWTIIVECQMVVLPQKLAWPLLPDLNDDEKVDAAWTKLQQMIEHGQATLVANLSVRGDAGRRMVAEEIRELRYPTEFTPPQLPQTIPDQHGAEAIKNWPIVGATPTAFETRNVGATLELESKVSDDGQWIALQAVPQHVRFLRFEKFDCGVLRAGQHTNLEQPLFSTVKDTLTLHVRSGQRVLVGLHKVPEEGTTMELFFLRVRTQPAGNPK